MPSLLDYTKLANVNPDDVSQAAYEALDCLQNHPPHIQAAAVGTLFVAIAEALKASPQDVMTVISNVLHDDRNGRRPQFAALALYIEHELRRAPS
jgi:hypothetical protein